MIAQMFSFSNHLKGSVLLRFVQRWDLRCRGLECIRPFRPWKPGDFCRPDC